MEFCFHSDYHGNGYAYESCSAMMEYMIKERGVKVFAAGASPKNTPSCKLLEKPGFVLADTETRSLYTDNYGNDITFEGWSFIKKRGMILYD